MMTTGAESSATELAELRDTTVWEQLVVATERAPTRLALVGARDDGTIAHHTYRQLHDRVSAFSSGLASIGVRRGDRVVLWCTNTAEWVVAAFASMRLGATLVPVNTFLRPTEIRYLVAQSGARHLIMVDRFRTLDLPAMLTEFCPEFGLQHEPGTLLSEQLPDLRNVVVWNRGGGTHPQAFDFTDLEARGERDEHLGAFTDGLTSRVSGRDLAMVKYTSGSTGFPKGVMLEQGGIVACAKLHSRRVGIDANDVYFSMMPFFHGGGSIWGLMTMMTNAGTLVFTEAFDASLGSRLIERYRATVAFGVLLDEIADATVADGRTLPSLRIADGSNATNRRAFPNSTFAISPFGLTEAYGPAAVNAPTDPPPRRDETCGRMLDGNECRVVDPETGAEVPPGVVGEAWIRGNVMRGYWNKPAESAAALDAEGWLHSEDLVSMDAEGYITYVGRVKLMLKVGGENVSIEEVENVIALHESVRACAVVGAHDTRKGEAVRAYVVPTDPATAVDVDALLAWLGPQLARFKMPRDVIVVEALPLLGNGKVDRVALRTRSDESEAPARRA